jgi:hypothetical protein
MHAHEEVCDWSFKVFIERLKCDPNVIVVEELRGFLLKPIFLFAFVQSLKQSLALSASLLRQHVLFCANCVN